MPLRQSLDLPRAEFVRQWCLDVDPRHSEEEIRQALAAVEAHLPEQLDELERRGTRGIHPILRLVEMGLVLAQCEGLDGFPAVIARARIGERSAVSELVFAAHMKRLGLDPSLEPTIGDKKLDTLLSHEERKIYSEVITPEVSDENQEINAELNALAQTIASHNKGADTEVLLSPDYDASRREELLAAINAAPIGVRLNEIAGVAKFVKFGDPVGVVAGRLQAAGPAMVVAHTMVEAGQRTIAIVRAPTDDLRARRLLAGELHHFSREERNLLAIDVSQIIAGVRDWEGPIKNCFKPNQNTRLGAVILFDTGSFVGEKRIHKRWKVLRNPYARMPLSEDLLKRIESLDDGPY